MSETPQENGIAGIKKIKFDFEFTYSKGGDEDIGDTIVLKAPSYEDIETHARMTSLVTKGMFGAMPFIKDMAENNENADKEQPKEANEASDQERSSMFLMALGMSDKKYVEFLMYVKNLLTNDNRYAHIEGEKIGITDLLWKELEKQGGKATIDQIISEFVSFFIEAMDGKKAA